MQPKKHPKSDLERQRFSFFKIGLIAVLALVWMALEWKSYEKSPFDFGNLMMDDVEEEIIPPTFPKEKPPPPPPPPSPPEPIDDDKKIEKEYKVKDESINENTEIEPIPEVEVFEEPDIFISVEEMPSFGKGYADLMKYLSNCIKYPVMAKDIGIEGTVYLKFVVDEKGEIANVIVQRGLGSGCDKVAVSCVKNMPKWNPGKQRGMPVKVWFSLPVKFRLR